ncbi:MAG: hypothetical protein KC422_15810 [Trueperaceae bacterium]|nr:hypothetical protein [Trueperaceae bacterium]
MKLFTCLVLTLLSFGYAQLSGTYQSESEQGTATLTVNQTGDQVSGTLSGSATGSFEGSWDGQVATGLISLTINGSSATLVFGMEPSETGLVFALAEIDPTTQEVNMDTLTSFDYQRVSGAGASQSSNPLASQPASNPLAQSTTYEGSYANEAIELNLRQEANGYSGTLVASGQSFEVVAQEQGGQLVGSFGQGFSFSASLSGSTLTLVSDGASYVLERQSSGSTNPLSVPAPGPLPTGANPIQAKKQYQAGEQLSSAVTGVSFSIPQGYIGAFEPTEQIFALVANDQSGLIVVEAASNASAEELATALLTEIAASFGDDVQASVIAGPTQQGDTLSITYNIAGNILHTAARQGSAGNAVVFSGYSNAQSITQTVDALAASSQFSSPQTGASSLNPGGVDFYNNSNDSYYSPGGVGDGSFAGQTERSYTFCSDGSYGFQYSSESFVSVDGAGSMSSTDSDTHQGQWRLTYTLMGTPTLILQATDGRFFTTKLEQVPEGYVIDGYLYQASRSQQCN